MPKRLGELLAAQGKIDSDKLQRTLRLQAESGGRIGALLVQLGLIAERDVAQALAEQLGLPLAQPEQYPEARVLENQVSAEFLKASKLVPLWADIDRLGVAMADPLDQYTVDALALATGKRVERCVGVVSDIETAFQRQYRDGGSPMAQIVEDISVEGEAQDFDIQQLRDLASEAPIIRLVNMVISRAMATRASDIHIEPFESDLKVRYRVDGVLRDVEAPPAASSAAVISRVKVMAHLDIAERRLPQDGRIKLRIEGREIDMRVSTVPTMYGESVVMRILDKGSVPLEFPALGFLPDTLEAFEGVLARPHGIVLVTGPTGSGKTTTLYAALQSLNTVERKILTVEDPVEYELEGINQIQVKPQIKLTFANALRSILRQDPDVIMVGEMRDIETAKIAVQAALTGHKVFSTLHTNDAPSSVTRLLDMGVEDYLLTSTVECVVAQRLIRTLCSACLSAYPALPELVAELGLDRFSDDRRIVLHAAEGCPQCDGSGYRGRTSILELLVMSDPIRQAILSRADAGAIAQAAIDQGMRQMYEDGLRKAVSGQTTIEEVVRVTQES